MKTFSTVEDYLEVIAGKRDSSGSLLQRGWLGYEFKPIVNLARYDVNFLDSVTDSTISGGQLTDKQAELAVRLVQKYQRQLATRGIDLDNIDPPIYRKPLRIVDRKKTASIDGGYIVLKFPYDTKIIEYIRTVAKESHGRIVFDREAKVWKVALTEYNLNWVTELARQQQFEVTDDITNFMKQIIDMEAIGYAIQLVKTDTGFAIENASQSLVDYLHTRGGFGYSNRDTLVDLAPVLGYTVSEEIKKDIEEDLGGSIALLLNSREYDMNHAEDAIPRIVAYAELTNRWPIVAFNPTPAETLNDWMKYFEHDEILVLGNRKERQVEIEPHHKVIYTHRALKQTNSIPLLISHAGMIVGYDKQYMIGRSEKIIYAGVKLKS